MSAYFIWMNANREKIKTEFPDLSVTEFGKKAGEMWKAMTDKSVSKAHIVVGTTEAIVCGFLGMGEQGCRRQETLRRRDGEMAEGGRF